MGKTWLSILFGIGVFVLVSALGRIVSAVYDRFLIKSIIQHDWSKIDLEHPQREEQQMKFKVGQRVKRVGGESKGAIKKICNEFVVSVRWDKTGSEFTIHINEISPIPFPEVGQQVELKNGIHPLEALYPAGLPAAIIEMEGKIKVIQVDTGDNTACVETEKCGNVWVYTKYLKTTTPPVAEELDAPEFKVGDWVRVRKDAKSVGWSGWNPEGKMDKYIGGVFQIAEVNHSNRYPYRLRHENGNRVGFGENEPQGWYWGKEVLEPASPPRTVERVDDYSDLPEPNRRNGKRADTPICDEIKAWVKSKPSLDLMQALNPSYDVKYEHFTEPNGSHGTRAILTIKPIKRKWTPAEIAEAQRVIGECWAALAPRFATNVRIGWYSPEYVRVTVTKGKLENDFFAHASDRDEPNAIIGLMVAMCKAASKPLPEWVKDDGRKERKDAS